MGKVNDWRGKEKAEARADYIHDVKYVFVLPADNREGRRVKERLRPKIKTKVKAIPTIKDYPKPDPPAHYVVEVDWADAPKPKHRFPLAL